MLWVHDIPERTSDNTDDPGFLDHQWAWGVDFVVSLSCPQIVRTQFLKTPPEGVTDVHEVLLPEYWGLLQFFWVLSNGKSKTGVTVHYMNENLDDGPILVQTEVPIRPDDTMHSLVLRSKAEYGPTALAEAVEKILDGEVETTENPESDATHVSFLTREAIARFRKGRHQIR